MSLPQPATVPSAVADLSLAEAGKRRIEWAFQSMLVLQAIRKHLITTQPFSTTRIAACLPVTPAVANLLITLRDGGAKIVLAGSHRVDDDVSASLVRDYRIPVFGRAAEGPEERAAHLAKALEHEPQLVLDHAGGLISALERAGGTRRDNLQGGLVETREGAAHLRRRCAEGPLAYPVIAMHQSSIRQTFHSRFGAGQSTLDALVRALPVLLAGMNVVISGFGAAGRGIAVRAAGLGANVIITEVDPLRALEAVMEGYRVTSIAEAAGLGDVLITASGNRSVIGREHLDKLRNGAILCNAGQSDAEIDLATLRQLASARRAAQEGVEEIAMRDGRRLYLLNGGLPLQPHAAEGQPSPVLDLCFANEALSAEYLLQQRASLENRLHPVPREIDRQVARLKLDSMGVKIDRLTVEQEQYLLSSSEDV